MACGRATPLAGDQAFPTEWRDRVDRLLGLGLAEIRRAVSSEPAVALLSRSLRETPQPVQLITLGPLTTHAFYLTLFS